MKIIAGLGNPEKRYEATYHNLGFIAADNLANRLGVKFKLKSALNCTMAEGSFESERFIIVKPTTYMNLSGECIKKVLYKFNSSPSDLLVIYDDIDIETGQIRFRLHGSPGTHNGMRNITQLIGSNDFKRVRIGSKPTDDSLPLIEYVLSKIPKSKFDVLNKAIERAAMLAEGYIKGVSIDLLMQEYNRRIE